MSVSILSATSELGNTMQPSASAAADCMRYTAADLCTGPSALACNQAYMDVLLNKKLLSYLRTEECQRVLAALPPNMMVTLPYNGIVHSAGSMLQMCYNEDTKAAHVGRNGSSVLGHFLLHLANTDCLKQHYCLHAMWGHLALLQAVAGKTTPAPCQTTRPHLDQCINTQ